MQIEIRQKSDNMNIEEALRYISNIPKAKTKIQKLTGKRPGDSSREIPRLLEKAAQIDSVFAGFNVFVSIEILEDETIYSVDTEEDGMYYTRIAKMIINDEFNALTTNATLHEMMLFIEKHKKVGNKLSVEHEKGHVRIFNALN